MYPLEGSAEATANCEADSLCLHVSSQPKECFMETELNLSSRMPAENPKLTQFYLWNLISENH